MISKILFLVKNFTQDKNGTKPQENKYKNALDWKCLCGAFAPSLQKYEFVPSKTNILSYFSHLQTIFFEAFSSADNAGRFHSSHTLCCLFSGLAECRLLKIVLHVWSVIGYSDQILVWSNDRIFVYIFRCLSWVLNRSIQNSTIWTNAG